MKHNRNYQINIPEPVFYDLSQREYNKNYKIPIEETTAEEIIQKSVDNIRLKQIQEKCNLEAEMEHNKQTIGSPLPRNEMKTYFENIMKNYQLFKKPLKLW